MNNYYPGGTLARVDYQDGVSYGAAFENGLLTLASALAFGGRITPYYTWDDGVGADVLAIGFNGSDTIGKSTYNVNGDTEMSALIEAFQTACDGGVFIGNSPEIQGATFAGAITMTQGRNMGSDVSFRNCVFTDDGGTGQALNISMDNGANFGFDDCDFSGAAAGFAVNFSTVAPGRLNTQGANLSNIPGGTNINTTDVRVQVDCGESGGSFSMNGAIVTALNFADYDGEGSSFDGGYVAAGIWWDDPENNPLPTLGFSGGVAGVTVPESCATKFCAFNAGDDCPYDITLNVAAGWTPDYNNWLSLRSWSGHTLFVTGAVTGGSGSESDPYFTFLVVELIGTTNITGASFTGNHYIVTGKWIEANQSHTVGDKNIYVLYDGNDAGRHIGIGIGNTTGATDSAVVTYQALGAESNVTINGLSGISLTKDGKVCVGEQLTDLYTEGTTFDGYTLRLYEYRNDAWVQITDYDVDTSTDGENFRLVPVPPASSLTAPYHVLLSVTDTGTTFNIEWKISESSGERDVSTESELSEALGDESIDTINIVNNNITLSADTEFNKAVNITEGVTLTVPVDITLEIDEGCGLALIEDGSTLSVSGTVYTYGYIICNDWDAHVDTSGGGYVYTYGNFGDFAIELYNRYSEDYGLSDNAAFGAYEGFYNSNYFSDEYAASSITALNFLIENGAIIFNEDGNFFGWDKITYSEAMGILDRLADAIETHAGLTGITGYGIEGWTVADQGGFLLTNAVNNVSEGTRITELLNSFAGAVGTLSVSGDVSYSPGLDNNRYNLNKTYSGTVAIECADGELCLFRFAGCVFNGDITIIGGTGEGSDDIRLDSCTINGNITVMDDDGNTRIYYTGDTTIGSGNTVTVTEASSGGAQDSARLGPDRSAVMLYNLPAGTAVNNDSVGVTISVTGESVEGSTITINGVEVTGGSGEYFVAATCWDNVGTEAEPVYVPVMFAAGSTAELDATNDATESGGGFAKFWLYEDAERSLSASDTVLIPKAGSAVNIANSANARFQVSFDGGTTVIDPIIYYDSGSEDYRINVPDVTGITYQIDTGSDYLPYTQSGGVITLPSGVNYETTDVAMIITDTGSDTDVGIDALAKDDTGNLSVETLDAVFTKVTAYDETGEILTFYNGVSVDFSSAEGYEDLSVGNYVNYAIFGGVYRIEKAVVIRDQITSKNSSGRITTYEGTQYFPSGETNASDLLTYDNDVVVSLQGAHNYTFYLDPFGDIIALDESQTTVTSFAAPAIFLLSAEESGGVYTVSTSLFPSEAYTLNADDPLTLQAFEACDSDSPVLVRCTITESVLTASEMAVPFTASITKGVTQIGVDGDGPVNAGDSTYFCYFSTGTGEYDSYHGIDETPTVGEIPTDAYYLPGSDGNASVVLVITEDTIPPLGGPVVGEGYVYIDNVESYSYTISGRYTCYTYSAYGLNDTIDINLVSRIAAAGFYYYVAYSSGLCELTKCEATTDGGNELSGTLTEFNTKNNRMYIGTDYCDLTDDTIIYFDVGISGLNVGDTVCALVDSENEAVIIFITTDA